eukprot:gene28022-31123_t
MYLYARVWRAEATSATHGSTTLSDLNLNYEGTGYLSYPWFDHQSTIATLEGWVRSMSYDRTELVGDHGTFLAVDDAGSVIKIVPERVYEEDGKKGIKTQVFTVDGRQGQANSHLPGSLPILIRSRNDRGVFKYEWENEYRTNVSDLETDVEFEEALVVDHLGNLSIFSVANGQLQATKKQMYAVATAREVSIWLIDHDLDFNVLRGGHEKAVITIYTSSLDNTVRLWDPYDMAVIRVLEEERSEMSAMTFYEAWSILVTGHDNGDIRLWDLDTASYDGYVILWDIRSLRNEPPYMVAKFRAHGGPDHSLGNFNKMAAQVAKLNESVKALELGGSTKRGHSSQGSGQSDISVTPRTPSASGKSTTGGTASRFLPTTEPEVLCVKYDPAKKVIISAGNDSTIKVWSANGYFFKGQHVGHKDAVTCLALDANFLFSGSDDCTICLWDTVPTPADGKVLEGHTRSVTGVELISSSGNLASVSLDGTLRFWDYITGTVLKQYNHHEEFRCLAIRSDLDEALVGTMQASILRYSTKEEPDGEEMNPEMSEVVSRQSGPPKSSLKKRDTAASRARSRSGAGGSRSTTAETTGSKGRGKVALDPTMVAAAAEEGLELNEADTYMLEESASGSAGSSDDGC